MAIIKQIIVYSLIFPNFLTSGHLTVILYTPMIVQNNQNGLKNRLLSYISGSLNLILSH